MTEFKNPAGAARAATIALYAYMILDPVLAVLQFQYPLSDSALGEAGPADYAAIPWLLAFFACLILVGRWIYRTNANAHVFSSGMEISPGWAVGWFFVPFANLVMPYQGVKETWRESHEAAGCLDEMDSSLLGWWWGLWIATNFLGNLGLMFGNGTAEALEGAVYVNLLASALNVALCLVLIRLIDRLSRVQVMASEGSVFA